MGEIKREERIKLSPEGYKKVCEMVDERASPKGYIRCEWCGKSIGRFHHHHIRFRSEYGSDTIDNLILLCENCHEIYAHGTKSKKFRILFKDCRMEVDPIKSWNREHEEEAAKIYKRFRRNKK